MKEKIRMRAGVWEGKVDAIAVNSNWNDSSFSCLWRWTAGQKTRRWSVVAFLSRKSRSAMLWRQRLWRQRFVVEVSLTDMNLWISQVLPNNRKDILKETSQENSSRMAVFLTGPGTMPSQTTNQALTPHGKAPGEHVTSQEVEPAVFPG